MMGRLLSYSFSLDEAVPDDQIGAEAKTRVSTRVSHIRRPHSQTGDPPFRPVVLLCPHAGTSMSCAPHATITNSSSSSSTNAASTCPLA
jgi:hypothetical protein